MSNQYLPKQSVDDRELRKFKADGNGDVAVNVVLADLTAILAALQSIFNSVDDLESFTDNLEALAAAANTLLTTIRDNADQLEGYTDEIEGLLTDANAIATVTQTLLQTEFDQTQTLLQTEFDQTQTAIGTTNTSLSTIIAALGNILTALTTGDQQGYGTTTQFAGTVGLASTAIPNVAGDFISTVLIRCPEQTPVTNRLSYSFDNVTFHVLAPGEFIAWSLKGNKTQVYLKGNVAAVSYELTLNREPA